MNTHPRIAFFGTPDFAVWVLEALAVHNIKPNLVITAPDAPKGRKLIMTAPAAKVWATSNNIPVIQPEGVKDETFAEELARLAPADTNGDRAWDLFIVAAYGFIIPERILYMPRHKTINVHPSLLPLLRGSSPVHSAILQDMRETGVSIMMLDKEMDHGPILAQKKATLETWPTDTNTLAHTLAVEGGNLIADLMPKILAGTAATVEQNHSQATFTKKIHKEDGLIDLSDDARQNFLKYHAYKGWPTTYFFKEIEGKRTRFVITEAALENGSFVIKKVIPEGRKEVVYIP
jgi:methionyl-tRNA formyltransferase